MRNVINRMARRRRTDGAVLMARLVDRQGVLLDRSAVQSIYFVAVEVTHVGGAPLPVACAALEPGEVVLDGLQNGNGWSVDAVGYNFCHRFDLNCLDLPRDGAGYEIRYVVQDMAGEISVICFRVRTLEHD
jgi:hypothetical protein